MYNWKLKKIIIDFFGLLEIENNNNNNNNILLGGFPVAGMRKKK